MMPIPKDKQDLYGKVIGKNINEGKSVKAAKAIAERATVSPRGDHEDTNSPKAQNKDKKGVKKRSKMSKAGRY